MFKQLEKIKYFIAFTVLLLGLYSYASVTGWKFFSSNTEKWEAEGQKGYHK